MKKTISIAAALLGLAAIASAQTKGDIYVGASLGAGFSKSSYTSPMINYETGEKDGKITSENKDRSGSIGINGGYFVTDNIAVGLELGISRNSSENSKLSHFLFSPSVTYFLPITEKISYTPFAAIELTSDGGKYKSGKKWKAGDNQTGFGFDLVPIAFQYKYDEHLAFTCAPLYFTYTSSSKDDSKHTSSSLGLSLISFGIRYYL